MSIGIFNYLPVGKLAQFVAVHQGQSLCHPPVSSQRQVHHAALSLYPRCLAKALHAYVDQEAFYFMFYTVVFTVSGFC